MTANANKPRCMIPRRSVRRTAGNIRYDLREIIFPVLGELLAGLLLIGGAALLPALLLLFA